MNAEILCTMLELQHSLNVVTIGEKWADLPLPWDVAIGQEAAEGIDHLGWPWWKKQEPNLPAARMEAVDILHFVLSYEMKKMGYDLNFSVLAKLLEVEINTCSRVVYLAGRRFAYAEYEPLRLFQLIQAMAALQRCEIAVVFSLANQLGLSDNQFGKLYRVKATLNLFRQHKGYKHGAYIKRWPMTGEAIYFGEDNDVLQEVLTDKIDWSKPEAPSLLYAELDRYYTDFVIPNAQK